MRSPFTRPRKTPVLILDMLTRELGGLGTEKVPIITGAPS